MKVLLESITLTNFRGIRSLTIGFDSQTTIFGDNRTGKTTIYNAFLWLLFGKDNLDRKDFEIKTLGPDNQPYHRLDHEVSATLVINHGTNNLKRTYREKWVKKKGSTEAEFSGHETLLFWNDVPYKLEDFQAKVNAILKENVFKMITSTGYFNSMKWQDRRSILLELAGNIQDTELLQSLSEKQNGKYDDLIKALGGNKTLKEYASEIANKKRKIRDELDHMPSRIQEANHSLPDQKDYAALEAELNGYRELILAIDNQLMDKTTAQQEHQDNISAKIKKVGDFRVSLNGIEFHIKNEVKDKRQAREQSLLDLKRELQSFNDSDTRINSDLLSEQARMNRLANEKSQLTEKWHKINNEKLFFDEGKFCCPTCKRLYENTDIESKKQEFTKNFNADKSSRLTEITEAGKKLAAQIETLTVKIQGLKNNLESVKNSIAAKQNEISVLVDQNNTLTSNEDISIRNEIASNSQHKAFSAEILSLQEEINAPQPEDENKSDLLQQKRDLNTKISELSNEISTKGQREKILARISELTDSESKMSNELASFEKIEFNMYEFDRAKMDEVEARINDRFAMVRFKMFREQVNGGQEPCCETLIDGVPFGVANTASQINAGLDIINVMSDHFDIYAPVFVDNRESVVDLIPSSSQIINMVVVRGALLSVNKIKYRKDFKPAEAEMEA